MQSIWRLFLLLLALACLTPSFASTQFEKEIEAVREVYLIATDGNARDIRRAAKKIRQLEKQYPGNPLILAYKGGVLALRGKEIGKRPLDRMRETEEGLHIIDRALRTLRSHKGHYLEIVEARLVATYVFINLPDSVFHRLREGQHIVKQLLAHPQFEKMPQGLQAAIYFAAAIAAKKYNNTTQQKHYLELALKADPNGKSGQQAKIQLKHLTN
ncbi:hypothetical protein MNBD_GAMMA17-1194 [hydrothermal vent metagenome]|uniref:Uncharacterized protein n=1 Tax=hydrothermal vent metagenome TaxID=652676 RepID=A0A3B0ZG19_9ZZZZ